MFRIKISLIPKARIQAVAAAEELDIRDFALVAVPHSHAAADKAVELARTGDVELLMKGSLHTNDTKGILSPVAGDPDILVAPDLEAGTGRAALVR